ncbi:putative membrane protein DUF2207 [Kribbella sp. VKM Ac-2569]|uniref:DUF2207 domain-containing protein n=1 Tax=Kribbella sp. VKM Ac-2569 TaxID=2512220 RepID=UPI0010CE72FA|nr:DUF2207 domain-containing protein [Kribbella sp. VKM Ac-2569]RZT27740.1 putative membrane protein DUF2207 [Kribbella sp. VKM Ac-2569]
MAGSVARRRKKDALWLVTGVLLIGLVGLLVGLLAQTGEQVARMWVGAEVRTDGSARITEVIDYDFAGNDKHGIFRTVPLDKRGDLRDVSITMDGAEVPFRLNGSVVTKMMIGDAASTVTGTHRYRIEYTLRTLGNPERLAWDAVGTEWEVPIRRVEVHVATPYGLRSVQCNAGSYGSEDPCATMRQPRPGQLDAGHGGLDKGQGLTVYGEFTASGGGATLPEPPTGPATAESEGHLAQGWLWITGIALVAALVIAELLRLAGRQHVRGGRRMDLGKLAGTVQPSSVPPAELGAAQAGILLTGQVRKNHLVAWLLGAAMDGHLRVTGATRPVLRRAMEEPGNADELTERVVGTLFARNPDVSLRKYNKNFAEAWHELESGLNDWRLSDDMELWVPGAERARRVALIAGVLAAVAGVIVLIFTADGALESGTAWRTPTAVGAALAGGGLAAVLRSWELRARTARGSELWCQAEAYRLYLAGLEGWDGRDEDLLTAWAAGLGETTSWTIEAERATKQGGSARQAQPGYLHDRWKLGLHLPMAVDSARSSSGSSAGSSSSSSYSGSSSSGVGGGSGGGGGGSW